MPRPLVVTRNLTKFFEYRVGVVKKAFVHAVDGVDLSIRKRETLGLVGESGCGKTTTARCILRLIAPTKGQIYFEGKDITKLSQKEMRKIRPNMQIVFQNPLAALNPRMSIEKTLSEPIRINENVKGIDLRKRVAALLRNVHLNPTRYMKRFPHQLSGGEQQRICIARALALNPKFIVLDEPTASLDVSVQAAVLNILQDLQEELGLTYLFISHNLCVVEHVSHRIGIMYLGKLVEVATKEEIFKEPLHPYTISLLSAIPIPDPHIKKSQILLKGDVPSPVNLPSGCRFYPRCWMARYECKEQSPKLVDVGNSHYVACNLWK